MICIALVKFLNSSQSAHDTINKTCLQECSNLKTVEYIYNNLQMILNINKIFFRLLDFTKLSYMARFYFVIRLLFKKLF